MIASYLNTFCFGVYPYIAMTIFLLGSLIRYERDQYTWKADSSQLLRRGTLRLGSNLFHIGILGLFGGHFVGLLTPHWLYTSMGLSTSNKQLLAMSAGGIMGTMAFIGALLLIHRRLSDPRIRDTSTKMDIFILLWIFVTLCLGLTTIFFSSHHMDGSVMIILADWAQSIATFRPAAHYMIAAPFIYKVHMMFGMTLFVLFPFSRLVHIWSGLATVTYLTRAPQIVRKRS